MSEMFVDGYTYERSAIQGWIDKGKDTSPMTSIPLKTKQLIPNRSLKMLIQHYLESGKWQSGSSLFNTYIDMCFRWHLFTDNQFHVTKNQNILLSHCERFNIEIM